MRCCLCNENRKIVESHIIPRFFYEGMSDQKGRPFRYKILNIDSERVITGQGGVKEPLLCEMCEQKLGRFDKYVSEFLYGGVEIEIRQIPGRRCLVEGLDYKKFKLFQLSILWRASLSSQDIFKEVNLGEFHESEIRNMLLNEDPGPPEKYGCIMVAVIFENKVIDDAIMNPTATWVNGHKIYRFLFGGFVWAFIVSSHGFPEKLRELFLNEQGQLVIIAQKMSRLGMITGFINDLIRRGILPLQ